MDQEQACVELCLADFACFVAITNRVSLVHQGSKRLGSRQDIIVVVMIIHLMIISAAIRRISSEGCYYGSRRRQSLSYTASY